MRKVDQLNNYYSGLIEESLNADYLEHHGILGMKWGVRRYQNANGTLTAEGRARYLKNDGSLTSEGKQAYNKLGERAKYHNDKMKTSKTGIAKAVHEHGAESATRSQEQINLEQRKAKAPKELLNSSRFVDSDGVPYTSKEIKKAVQYEQWECLGNSEYGEDYYYPALRKKLNKKPSERVNFGEGVSFEENNKLVVDALKKASKQDSYDADYYEDMKALITEADQELTLRKKLNDKTYI